VYTISAVSFCPVSRYTHIHIYKIVQLRHVEMNPGNPHPLARFMWRYCCVCQEEYVYTGPRRFAHSDLVHRYETYYTTDECTYIYRHASTCPRKMRKSKKPKRKKGAKKRASTKRPEITFLYVLVSLAPPGKYSYVGVTNNIARRIRQHNGEIVGGARYTSMHAPWRVYAMFQLANRHDALSLEWKVKHRKRASDGTGIDGRVHAVKRLGAGISGFHQCV